MKFTDLDKLKELDRELAMRRIVYPRYVAAHKMKPDAADRQMQILTEIAEEYRNRVRSKATL